MGNGCGYYKDNLKREEKDIEAGKVQANGIKKAKKEGTSMNIRINFISI